MTRRLRLDGQQSGQKLVSVDDRASGGTSQARLVPVPTGQSGAIECDIRPGFAWPYCELQIDLSAAELDLTPFSRIRLWLQAEGPTLDGSAPQVRLFLRNFDSRYAGAGTVADLKPHEVSYAPGAQARPVEFRLSQFMVSSWWMQSHSLPIDLIGPQLEHVRVFSISTGAQVAPGRHIIRLERAELLGYWVSPGRFRLGLVGLWMFSLLGYLAWEAWTTRGRLQRSLSGERALKRAHHELQRRSIDLEQLALSDSLTRVANREGLTRKLQLLLELQEAVCFPLSVVFADIDHFKRINDAHGHETGDRVLLAFAQALRANLPRDDLLARWGGEEFVVVMPQTSAAEARAVAERLRHVLSQVVWPQGLTVTASWGVAQAASDVQLEAALRAADQAMYRAKREGRDRVTLA
jgi:diguanylate cyclase (GGDEF)-like protein